MKKRTKITLRTKIYLTIVALLALTGVFYAANPTFFTSVPFATGVAASRTDLLVSEYCTDNIDTVACDGTVSLFATIPGFGSCREKYIAIAPSQSAAAGFTPRDVFVTQGAMVFKIHEGTVSLFATLTGCLSSDHNGITFDHFGTYGFDMIVTCQEGNVFRIHGDGTGGGAPIASTGVGQIEGPAVVPPGFGPHGGKIWVADEAGNAVHAIGPPPTYTVTLNILSHVSAEGVFVIPSPPCTFCSGGAFFQSEQQITQAIYQYPLSDFTGLGGNVLVTSEQGGSGADTSLVTFNGTNYVQSSFGPRVPGVNEAASFVDCDVPTPTPTPTATATATATPCPLTEDYWKNHPDAWPVNSLMLGSQTYTKTELLNILNTPSGGDASLILADQLIAAKLNIANGSDPAPISSTITDADSLLSMFSGKLPYNVDPSTPIGQRMVKDARRLDRYNDGYYCGRL